MKLVKADYGIYMTFEENMVNILVIENKAMLVQVINELYIQSNGEEKGFILSDNARVIKMDKYCQVILEPFSIDCNDRKIIAKLYQEIENIAVEDMVQETMEMNSLISIYVDKLCNQVPYGMNYSIDIKPASILKLAEVKVDCDANSILGNLMDYMSLLNRICSVKVFVFVNIKELFEEEELMKLYEFAFYNKYYMLLIENSYTKYDNVLEKVMIIDRDRCIIPL